MSFAVFLRAVNVGGHQSFSTAQLAKDLAAFDVTNIGAAGTFVARKGTAAAVKKAIAAKLPFATEIMILDEKELRALVEDEPLAREPGRPFLAVMEKPPRAAKLPVEEKGARVVSVRGPCALCVVLPDARPGTNVTALVEKTFGVPATTRGWPTLERIVSAMDATGKA